MSYSPSGFGSGGGVVGHILKDPAGAVMDQKTYLKFIRGSGTQVEVTNGSDLTIVEVPDQLTAPNDDLAPWEGVLHSNWGDGNPNLPLWCLSGSSVGLTYIGALNFGTTTGRLMKFSFRKPITVRHVFVNTISSFSNLATFAIYNATTGARVWTSTVSGVAGAWTDIACNFTLAKNTPYWFGISVTNQSQQVLMFASVRAPLFGGLQSLSIIPAQLKNAGIVFAQMSGLVGGAWPDPAGTIGDAAWAADSGGALTLGTWPASGTTLPFVFFSSVA